MEPFVRLPKRIIETDWFKGNILKVFLWVLCKAVLTDTTYDGILLHRGQWATTYNQIATACGATYRQARDSVDGMVKAGLVARSVVRSKLVISIVSFDAYQGQWQTEWQTCGRPDGRPVADLRQPEITNKNNKKIDPGKWQWFEVLWNMYPNKTHRPEAETEFAKIDPDEELMGRIHNGLLHHKSSVTWSKDNGRYIPRLDKWLAEQRWNEMLEQKPDPFGGYKDLDWNDGS